MAKQTSQDIAERELIERCLDKDSRAWDMFVERYSGLIHGAIRSVLNRYAARDSSQERVRDLFQQVFVALCEDDCRRLASFGGKRGASLATWLRVVVSRLVIDDLRKTRPPTASLQNEQDEQAGAGASFANPRDPKPLPPELMQSQEARAFLAEELAGLKPRERLIMQLRFGEGLSGRETAAAMGISRNNLDQIVHRIKKGLMQKAEEKGLL